MPEVTVQRGSGVLRRKYKLRKIVFKRSPRELVKDKGHAGIDSTKGQSRNADAGQVEVAMSTRDSERTSSLGGLFNTVAKSFKETSESKPLTDTPDNINAGLVQIFNFMTAMCLGLTCKGFYDQNLQTHDHNKAEIDDVAHGSRPYEHLSNFMAPRGYYQKVNTFVSKKERKRAMKSKAEGSTKWLRQLKQIGASIRNLLGWEKLQRQFAIRKLRKMLKDEEKKQRREEQASKRTR